MADMHSSKTRSYNMSRIGSKDTAPEMLVRTFLHQKGFRYRLHDRSLPGTPDIVLPKYRTVIFVHGCFWHGHARCRYATLPATRKEWWSAKIANNTRRHEHMEQQLKDLGWHVIVVWGCELKRPVRQNNLIRIQTELMHRV
jgi:DNA mismatch endonuclease (patch repair protein)